MNLTYPMPTTIAHETSLCVVCQGVVHPGDRISLQPFVVVGERTWVHDRCLGIRHDQGLVECLDATCRKTKCRMARLQQRQLVKQRAQADPSDHLGDGTP